MIDSMRRREQALYAVLHDLPDVGAVVIGGYAASAWSFPRFSHDLDLLVPQARVTQLREHLSTHGLTMNRTRTDIEQNYGGGWERWAGGPHGTTIDLLTNSVQDRHFGIALPYAQAWRDHAVLPLRGLTRSDITLPIASKEVLLALKCQPMRAKDIGDICAIVYVGYDLRRLRALMEPLLARRALLANRVERLKRTLGATPEELHRSLAPRIVGFQRLRADLERSIMSYISTMERWIREGNPPEPGTG